MSTCIQMDRGAGGRRGGDTGRGVCRLLEFWAKRVSGSATPFPALISVSFLQNVSNSLKKYEVDILTILYI